MFELEGGSLLGVDVDIDDEEWLEKDGDLLTMLLEDLSPLCLLCNVMRLPLELLKLMDVEERDVEVVLTLDSEVNDVQLSNLVDTRVELKGCTLQGLLRSVTDILLLEIVLELQDS